MGTACRGPKTCPTALCRRRQLKQLCKHTLAVSLCCLVLAASGVSRPQLQLRGGGWGGVKTRIHTLIVTDIMTTTAAKKG